MPPPSESASAAKRRSPTRRIILVAVVAAAIGAVFAYTAMNPVRLMAQARPVSAAAEDAGRSKYRFPNAAGLPDGHRSVSLETPGPDRYDDSDEASRPKVTQLRLTSIDAPEMSRILISEVPKEMGSLVGVTNELLLVTASTAPPTKGTVDSEAAKPGAVMLTTFGIVGNPTMPRRILSHAPIPGTITQMALSPKGDRILWAISHERKPFTFVASAAKHVQLLARFAVVKNVLSLCETDGEGRNAIKIGDEVEPSEPEKGVVSMRPANFDYAADARHIRFAYGDGIYEVPSPRR